MLRGTRYTRSAELPFGSFLATQCSAPRERGCYFFIACPVRRAARACDKKAECYGMLRGTRYTRSAELPWAPFWRLNAAHLVNEAVIFLSRALCGEPRGRAIKKTPPLIAGVRCIGRSYRNRTYTMGVRGPCATTTPMCYHYTKLQRENDYNAGSRNLQSFSPTILTPPRAGTKLSV